MAAITIIEATEADVFFLAEIITYSHMGELVMPFSFKDWPKTTTIKPYYTARVQQKIIDPNSKIYKASNLVTNEILGFVSMTLEEGKEDIEKNLTNPAGFELPANFNMKFAGEMLSKLKELDNEMSGRRHYVLSLLSVDIEAQGQGIGTKLIKHCAEVADASGLPVWLTSYPGAHDLYLRLGYKDIASFGIDLDGWGRKGRGYGIYTSYGMLREPIAK